VAPHEVLPLELMHHIVDMLDLASVGRFECVCQAWRDVGHSSHVWQKVYRLRIASNPPHNFAPGPTPHTHERCCARCSHELTIHPCRKVA
jgi:hypothetical protein